MICIGFKYCVLFEYPSTICTVNSFINHFLIRTCEKLKLIEELFVTKGWGQGRQCNKLPAVQQQPHCRKDDLHLYPALSLFYDQDSKDWANAVLN